MNRLRGKGKNRVAREEASAIVQACNDALDQGGSPGSDWEDGGPKGDGL